MANNYSSASFVIPVKDDAQAQARMEAIEAWITDEEEGTLPADLFDDEETAGWVEDELRTRRVEHGDLGFAWEVDGGKLGIFHDESIDMEAAVLVAQIMLDLDDNTETFSATWADTCDRPRVGEFGGGAVAFTHERTEWKATHATARELVGLLTVDPDPDANWQNDAIQFPRLLAELEAILRPDDYIELAAAMDLPVERVHELFTRASAAWDGIKARTK